MTKAEFAQALRTVARATDELIQLFPTQGERDQLFQLFQQLAAVATRLSRAHVEP